jgi:hypothetical protein
MFKGLNYSYSTGVSFISTTNYSGGVDAAHPYSRWYKNGVLLQPVTDYNVGFSQYNNNQFIGATPFNAGDIIRLELYNTIQDRLVAGINNGNGVQLEFDEDTIRPRYSYLETYAPNANGILSTDTTDKSTIQQNPLVISKCSTTPINAHVISSIIIVNNRLNDTGSYTHGRFTLNGADVVNTDIDDQALQLGSFNFSGGIFTHNAENILLNIFSPLSNNIITYQHNGINTGDDFTVTINNIGFSKISSDNVLNRYIFYGEDVNSNPQFATATSLYSVEQTSTQYILRVDGVIVRTINRSVIYSTNLGSVSDGSMLPLGTSVNHIATNTGLGYIQALIDSNIVSRQVIQVNDTPAPIFSGGSSYTNICPSNSFDLGTLIPTNSQSGFTLKWYSDSGLTNQITNLVINTTQTVYASYESDSLVNCNLISLTVNITISGCTTTSTTSTSTSTTSTTSTTTTTTTSTTTQAPAKTPVPFIETLCVEEINPVIRGTTLPNSIVYLYNENTSFLTQTSSDSLGNFVFDMTTWYKLAMAYLIKAQAPTMEKSDYSAFVIKCNISCSTGRKKKYKC